MLWVLIVESESRSRGRGVGNDRDKHGALYGEVFGGLAGGQMRGSWLSARGFACCGATPLLELDSLEFLCRASWIGTRSIMTCLCGPEEKELRAIV